MNAPQVKVRRIYDDPTDQDGIRVLVDRVWPRGLTRSRAHIDEWCKHAAPSTDLRKWYAHDPQRFAEFTRRYQAEIDSADHAEALAHLESLAAAGTVTLLTATTQLTLSHAPVLAAAIISSAERERSDDIVDEWGKGSFPASDPPANWR